jgi:hypothetical protein
MKLTTEQIREIIRQELMEVYKGKKRIFYAPHHPYDLDKRAHSWPTGAYALPAENPYDQLDPDVKEKFAMDSDDEALAQAYELSSMLGSEPDMDVDEFIEAIKLSRNPDLVRQIAIKDLKDMIKRERARVRALPKDSPERDAGRRSVNRMMLRLSGLKRSEDMMKGGYKVGDEFK